MSIFNSMQINASGLNLERFKLDTISTNIAKREHDPHGRGTRALHKAAGTL
ncbi:MAG: hypothetical protein U5K84_10995 [Alkalibacterium sp.]|nr:hypothetical protein [Alkalibacterium sp.]